MSEPEYGSLQVQLDDPTLFGNDAGEDELPEILASYFVDTNQFSPFLNAKNNFCVARAKKGMGKSALLSKFAYDLEESGEPVIIRLVGSQLISDSIPVFSNFLEAQNYWIRSICSKINAHLGNEIGFSLNDTAMSLMESSEFSGIKGRSLIKALLSRIKTKYIEIEPSNPALGDSHALLTRALEKYDETIAWVLIDDIDASFRNTENNKTAVAAFYAALRFISTKIDGVVVRTTVRTDVWSNIRDVEDLDKCEQYMLDISWTRLELQKILLKKIWSWVDRNHPSSIESKMNISSQSQKIMELAFNHRIQWGGSATPPFQPINILSAGRPRWMSQLCRLCGASAIKNGRNRIGTTEIMQVMPDFTRYRLGDLQKEHGHQFSKLERLVSIFADSPVRYHIDELTTKINKEFVGPIGAMKVPDINEEPFNSPIQLAAFLFEIGFLVARFENPSNKDDVEFKTFTDEPELLKYGRPSRLNIIWEVYPSYRVRA